MPNNKRKRVSKIKGKEKAHPYSRKARQINRAMNKETLIAKAKGDRINMAMSRGQKLVWFRDNMDTEDIDYGSDNQLDKEGNKKIWTIREVGLLIDLYLQRHEEDVEEIECKRKAGRLLTPKEAHFIENVQVEARDAKLAGLEIPDLTNHQLVKILRAWDGDLNSVATIKQITCKPASAQDKEAEENESKLRRETADTVTAEQVIAEATGMTVG